MPWNYDDAQINGIIDGNLKDSPPAVPMSNTAASVRALLKAMWVAMRTQIATAVISIDATYSSLVARSLNLTATVYVDGVNGDDSRTGATDDLNAATGRLKTLARAAQLHSGKTMDLYIYVRNETPVDADATFNVPTLQLVMDPVCRILFKKKATNNCNNAFIFLGNTLQIAGGTQSTLETEAHGGNVTSLGADAYAQLQGGFRFQRSIDNNYRINKRQFVSVAGIKEVAGNNTTMYNALRMGGSIGGTIAYCEMHTLQNDTTLGTNAKRDTGFSYNFIRNYTPISSTDATLLDREMCFDTNFLYIKQPGGIIRKIAFVNF